MNPADLNALAAALDLPFRARREQHLYTRRGHGRVNAGAAVPPPRKIGLLGHVLAARLRAHLHLPLKVIGALPGADFTTVSHAVSLTTSLLASQDQPPAAPPPDIRLRTLDDLRDYAASHGITIPRPAEPPPHHMTQ